MNIIAVTNSKLLKDKNEFLNRIEEISKNKVHGIILREKDIHIEEYKNLALKCNEICSKYNIPLIINKYIDIAIDIGIRKINLSFNDFINNASIRDCFDIIGVSVHSIEEAIEAEKRKADYIIVGHIFETECKKGLLPKGIPFLNQICDKLSIPVYAIGGINSNNIHKILETKTSGICIMSSIMQCPIKDIKILLKNLGLCPIHGNLRFRL